MVFFAQRTNVEYSVGFKFSFNTEYIKACAESIKSTFPDRDIALICRGSSGTIIAGGVGMILNDSGINVTIIVSRKPREFSHGATLEGLRYVDEKGYALIVIDDFMISGDTIREIFSDIQIHASELLNRRFDALCVGNSIQPEGKLDKPWADMLERFDHIICNRKG